MPKVSVCIPTYNSGQFIQETVQSVLNQSFSDFELIICDDGSTDQTVDLIKSFKDSRIKLFENKKNIGMVHNFNRCLDLVKGDIVSLIGSDDVMLPDNLSLKVSVLDENPKVGFVHSHFLIIDQEGSNIAIDNKDSRSFGAGNPTEDYIRDGFHVFKQLLMEGNFICHSSAILKKECHDRLGKYNVHLRWGEDYEMWGRVSLDYDVAYLAEPLVKYRQHQANYTLAFDNSQGAVGVEELCRTRMAILQDYHRVERNHKLKKQELEKIYNEIVYLYLSWNNPHEGRKVLKEAYRHGLLNLKMLKYCLASFLPLNFINALKRLKNTFNMRS